MSWERRWSGPTGGPTFWNSGGVMEAWANHCEPKNAGNVVLITRKGA